MMREVVLVAVQPDEILERCGKTGLTVGLELGYADCHVGFEWLAREQILVTSAVMPIGKTSRIVFVTLNRAVCGDGLKQAVVPTQQHEAASGRRFSASFDSRFASGVVRRKSMKLIGVATLLSHDFRNAGSPREQSPILIGASARINAPAASAGFPRTERTTPGV